MWSNRTYDFFGREEKNCAEYMDENSQRDLSDKKITKHKNTPPVSVHCDEKLQRFVHLKIILEMSASCKIFYSINIFMC